MPLRALLELVQAAPQAFRREPAIDEGSGQQLLAAAVQRYEAAQLAANPDPVRLDTAYDTVLFCGLALLAARGYRTQAKEGHHELVLEAMAAELGLTEARHDEVDALRKRRNAKYTGLTRVSPADLKTALALARRILDETEAWFTRERAALLRRS